MSKKQKREKEYLKLLILLTLFKVPAKPILIIYLVESKYGKVISLHMQQYSHSLPSMKL